MTQEDQQAALEHELRKIITKFCFEMDLTFASCVGVLELVKHEVLTDAFLIEDVEEEGELDED